MKTEPQTRVVFVTSAYHIQVEARTVSDADRAPIGEIWHPDRASAETMILARETINVARAEKLLEAARDRLAEAKVLYGDDAETPPRGEIRA